MKSGWPHAILLLVFFPNENLIVRPEQCVPTHSLKILIYHRCSFLVVVYAPILFLWTLFKLHILAKVGSRQIISANRKSVNLRTYVFLDLRTFCKCGSLRICCCGPYMICGFGICGPNYFFGFKTSANPQIHTVIFLLTNIGLKCSNSNVRITFGFWDSFKTELHCIS
jgi:hypothetical protein